MWISRASVIWPASLLLLLLLLLPHITAVAQYRIESWTIDNGLPQNTVRSIVQTRDGYLWFTTYDGLVRFDGINFRVFDKSNTKGLTTNRFTCLYEDKDGTLWIGTGAGGGVTRYHDGVFTSYPIEGQVFDFTHDLNGELLIGSDTGQFYWRDGKVIRAPAEYQDYKRKHYLAPSGAQWIITASRAREVRNGRVTEYPVKLRTPATDVGLYEDRQQNLWLGDETGIYLLRDGQITHYFEKHGLPAHTSGRACAEDDEGGVWFTLISLAGNGVAYFKDGRFTVYGRSVGLNDLNVNTVFKDREGVIWLGTSAGLHRLIKQVVTAYSTANGLLNNEVYPILQARNGDVLIGSVAGLSRFRDGQFQNTRLPEPYHIVQALAEDSAGRLWIGVINGLVVEEKGKLKNLSSLVNGVTVLSILTDRSGNTWAGSGRGLFKFNGDQLTAHYTSKDGLPADDVTAIYEDRNGDLWVGTPGVLTQFKNGKFVSYPITKDGALDNIRAIYEDVDGTFWIGTYDNGLSRFRDGQFSHYTINDGLFSNGVFQILEDAHGYFWISCNRGIYRVSRRELNDFANGATASISSVAFGKEDGMLNVECNGGRAPAGIIAHDGKFWFPTMGGVVVVDPEAVSINRQTPPVRIESVTLERDPVDFQRGVSLEPGQRGLEISYSGLSYIKSDQIKFKHKLEGLDVDWVDVGTRRVAYFPYLPPGSYTFRVIAANSDGLWNNEGASLVVIVRTPFWQQLWFRLLCTIVFLGLVALAFRIRFKRLERRHAEREAFSRRLIESQENERKRIATELHDSLGQNLLIVKNWALVGLNSLAEDNPAREHLTEISETTSLALDEVRLIAHNLRPYQLERLGLTKTIEYMVQQIKNSSDIEFNTEIDNIDGLLSKEAEINLYRMVQECANNIIKHSAATNAWLSIKRSSGGAEITCRDDGNGFDTNVAWRKGGMGLTDIAERVRMLGGRYTIDTAAGKGATIHITIDSRKAQIIN